MTGSTLPLSLAVGTSQKVPHLQYAHGGVLFSTDANPASQASDDGSDERRLGASAVPPRLGVPTIAPLLYIDESARSTSATAVAAH
jgi:hypothetical protein